MMRKCCQRVTFELIGFIVVTGATFSLISIVNIIKNMPSVLEPLHVVRFSLSSILHTEHYVQLLAATSLIAGTVVLKNSFGHVINIDRIRGRKKRERVLA